MSNVTDIYRFLILHAYGGMYSDLDMLWKKNVDVDLKKVKMICGWENPPYKTVSNAFIGCQKGHKPLLTVVDDCLRMVKKLGAIGVYDVTGPDPNMKLHTLFLDVSRKFLKNHSTVILPKHCFFRNGFRRIARVFRRMNMSLRNEGSVSENNTRDNLNFSDITAFHYYNGHFPFRNLIRIPAVRKEFRDVLDALAGRS